VDIKLGGATADTEAYEAVKAVGGLFVLGTERHEARRIDNQLRGRAGRQGDPGETQFFVSVEDSLMRVFGGDRVQGVMNMLKIPDDEAIQNSMITRSLESAQTKIEGFNFDNRKQVLAYDDVINIQRGAMYTRRRALLTGDTAAVDAELLAIVQNNPDLLEVIKEKKEALTDAVFYNVARRMMLQTIDLLWVDHLEMMDYTRQNVNLRAYGQRDPLVEYKREGTAMYKDMEASFDRQVSEYLARLQPEMFQRIEQPKLVEIQEGAESVSRDTSTVAGSDKPGRNDVVKVTNGTEVREMKYKKAEELLAQGWVLTK
jgi:preprotein translocase subunit SecA